MKYMVLIVMAPSSEGRVGNGCRVRVETGPKLFERLDCVVFHGSFAENPAISVYPRGVSCWLERTTGKDHTMRGHGTLMWMCGAVVVVALVVVPATGSAFPFLPVVGCVLMMGAMMLMMGGMGRRGGDRR
jgi:hypothetical protein